MVHSGRVFSGVIGGAPICVGLATLPGALENRGLAEDLASHGTVVTATSVEAYVAQPRGKGPSSLEVQGIRVLLPAGFDSARHGWVQLTGTDSASLDADPDWTDRWTPTTAATGYLPPLRVSIVLDDRREPQAMAVDDLAQWSGPDQTGWSLAFVGAGLVLLVLLGLVVLRDERGATYLGG